LHNVAQHFASYYRKNPIIQCGRGSPVSLMDWWQAHIVKELRLWLLQKATSSSLTSPPLVKK